MTAETYSTFFEGGVFIVEEDFELPNDVTNALGVRSFTIKAGLYSVTTLNNNNLLVIF